MELFVLIAIFLIVFTRIIVWLFKPFNKGKYGEQKVASKLKRLNSKKYKVLNDILIRTYSKSSQIDHIVVSQFGIFVIETKHYKGLIFGNESSHKWKQILFNGNHSFRNPIHQCFGHIGTLKIVLRNFSYTPYFPIIVFSGDAEILQIKSEVPVIKLKRLLKYIRNQKEKVFLSEEEVVQIHQKLLQLNKKDKASRKEHIKVAKLASKSKITPKRCPKCNNRLVKRQGKYGFFYGCSDYPNCNYTKSYK